MTDQAFTPGEAVKYEVGRSGGRSFEWSARVVEMRGRRVLIEFAHWHDHRPVQRAVRPYKLRRAA